jgi:ankyrin repeat protein
MLDNSQLHYFRGKAMFKISCVVYAALVCTPTISWSMDMSINAQDASGDTQLLAAAEKGSVDVVCKLIAARANPNLGNNYGWTPLMAAALYDHYAIVKQLLRAQADVNARTSIGLTTLEAACMSENLQLVCLLLSVDPDIHIIEEFIEAHQDDIAQDPELESRLNDYFSRIAMQTAFQLQVLDNSNEGVDAMHCE